MRTERQTGFTLIELAVTVALVGILFSGVMISVNGLQRAFSENEAISQLRLRAEQALQRIVQVAGQAVTSDPAFEPFADVDSGDGFRGLRFQVIGSFNNSAPSYDDAAVVFIYGPNPGDEANAGVIIGRGTDLADVHSTAAGADATLGTSDDLTDFEVSGKGALELLLTDRYAPVDGEMLRIERRGRELTFTLRMNLQGRQGEPLLADDLEITERVALRQ